MYSIGEFSKINRITTKTLRHYDKIDLIKPYRIDDWTGYRYYSAEQLPQIRKILMFRDMGISLPDIKEIIRHKRNAGLLLRKRADQLTTEIKKDQNRLSKVLGYLTQIEGEEKMEKEIIIKSLPGVVAASMRRIVPGYDSYFDIVPKMGEYMKQVGAVCSVPEYCFTIYHDGEYRESDIDVEICEAVEKACKESEKVKFKTFEKVPYAACLMHKGPYSTLRETYNRLFTWISRGEYEVVDKPRESYIDGIWNKENPEEWLTEVQVPVKKGSADE